MSNFRLVKVKEPAVPYVPDERNFATTRPEKKPELDRENAREEEDGVHQCHAFLEVFNKKPKKLSSFAKIGNYAVIGRGFAATVNLATLRSEWGRTRVHRRGRGRNLLLVGHPDPWSVYVRHNMNQEVELLTLPGYAERPTLPDWSETPRWLDSREFATVNRTELQRHIGEEDSEGDSRVSFFREHTELRAGVTHIERVASRSIKGLKRFKLHLDDDKKTTVIASKVDICTGTGQQTYATTAAEDKDRGIKMSETLWREYLDPGPRSRIYSAEMYVAGDRQVKAGASVLITSAASPAGIQAGEHALCLDTGGKGGRPAAELVLLASRKINDGFPPIGRLDSLVRTKDGPLKTRLVTSETVDLYPTDDRMWFGESGRVASIEELNEGHLGLFCHVRGDPLRGHEAEPGKPLTKEDVSAGKLLVTFAPSKGRFVRGRSDGGVNKDELALDYGLFDQVIFNTGRNRGGRGRDPEREAGSAMELVWDFKDELETIRVEGSEGYEFPVGLQTSDGRLRILGAAGINNPVYKKDAKSRYFARYEDSLPWQARVFGEGVTLAAVTIAIANRFFKNDAENYNPCVNTATLDELKKAIGDAELAKRVHMMRHWRVRPLVSLKEVLRATEYWLHYFDRPITLNNAMPDREQRKGFAEELLSLEYTVPEINNAGFLTDDEKWQREKHAAGQRNIRPWQSLDGDGGKLAKLLLRYADFIGDPAERRKIRT